MYYDGIKKALDTTKERHCACDSESGDYLWMLLSRKTMNVFVFRTNCLAVIYLPAMEQFRCSATFWC